jgi:prepilin-type N-terminal cleavage/methylation domain-containing protein/prepilin-type processing-associated H-X9-DG protein
MNQLRFRRRIAFTLIELLVVVAVIAVLVALLLPAVQKVREAANRTQCQNNLKQIGLAAQNYHDATRSFPQNHRPTSASAATVRERWFTHLLPYLDQGPLYSQYDETSNWASTPATAVTLPNGTSYGPTTPVAAAAYNGNILVANTPLKVTQCPSAPEANRFDANPAGIGATPTTGWGATNPPAIAVTDYAAAYGIHPSLLNASPAVLSLAVQNPYGIITNNSGADTIATTISDVLDGTSNTILAVESAGRPYLYQAGVRVNIDLTKNVVNGGGWSRPASEYWLIGFTDKTGTVPIGSVAINAANGIDFAGTYPNKTVPSTTYFLNTDPSGQLYGFHGIGANVVFADGSVHLLNSSININVLAALLTRANNDSVPGNSY